MPQVGQVHVMGQAQKLIRTVIFDYSIIATSIFESIKLSSFFFFLQIFIRGETTKTLKMSPYLRLNLPWSYFIIVGFPIRIRNIIID